MSPLPSVAATIGRTPLVQLNRLTTGPEIWEDTAGAVDAFVAGVGTGERYLSTWLFQS